MQKKTSAKKPMVPRKPSTGVRQPMPKIEGAKPGAKKLMPKVQGAKPGVRQPMASPTRKSGVIVVMPNGSTVGLKDLGKVKPTPKPKPKPKTTTKAPTKMTPQDTYMKKILEKKNGKIYG
jgi:hypothetical protein